MKNTYVFRQTWKSASLFSANRFLGQHTVSICSTLQLGCLAICAWSVVEWNMRLHLLYLLCKFPCKKSTKRQSGTNRKIGTSISKTPQLKKKRVQEKSACDKLQIFFDFVLSKKCAMISSVFWANFHKKRQQAGRTVTVGKWVFFISKTPNMPKTTLPTFPFLSLYRYCRNSFFVWKYAFIRFRDNHVYGIQFWNTSMIFLWIRAYSVCNEKKKEKRKSGHPKKKSTIRKPLLWNIRIYDNIHVLWLWMLRNCAVKIVRSKNGCKKNFYFCKNP